MLIDKLRNSMLLCGIDCVVARELLGITSDNKFDINVVTDTQFIQPGTSLNGKNISWPDNLDDARWNDLLEDVVAKLDIGTAVIVFEDNLPAGLLMLWQQAAPMALFKRADELLTLISQ